MSSPVAMRRPMSPSSVSEASSYISGSTAVSDSSASHALVYTREELLALATSPLAQTDAPSHLRAFPQIMRRKRRGLVEAYRTLEYERITSSGGRFVHDLEPYRADVPAARASAYVPPWRRVRDAVDPGRQQGREGKTRSWRQTRLGRVEGDTGGKP